MEKNQSQRYFYNLIHIIPVRLSKTVPRIQILAVDPVLLLTVGTNQMQL